MNCCADPCYVTTVNTDCFTESNPLIIGVIAEINTNVVVFIQNMATKRIDQYQATSSASGVVEVFDEDETIYLSQRTPFTIWIKAADDLPGDNLLITFDEIDYDCVELRIEA